MQSFFILDLDASLYDVLNKWSFRRHWMFEKGFNEAKVQYV